MTVRPLNLESSILITHSYLILKNEPLRSKEEPLLGHGQRPGDQALSEPALGIPCSGGARTESGDEEGVSTLLASEVEYFFLGLKRARGGDAGAHLGRGGSRRIRSRRSSSLAL